MKNSDSKKHLLCFVTHAPTFESCFPVLERLSTRNKVDVDIIVSDRLIHKDVYIKNTLAQSGMNFRIQSRLKIELFSFSELKHADAILSHSDPYAYRKASRPRDHYLPASGTPQIFIQHGLIQTGLNWGDVNSDSNWYSDLILCWEGNTSEYSDNLKSDIRHKVKQTGFIKKQYSTPTPLAPDLEQFFSGFRQRLLVCTSFGDQISRFGMDTQKQLYQMLDQFCERNPDILLIIRPHRARNEKLEKEQIDLVQKKRQNLINMDRYRGPFAYSTIQDGLAICDAVVSHASTTILDALYANKPCAALENQMLQLNSLPQVDDIASLEDFSTNLQNIDPKVEYLRQSYGEIDKNLDRASIHIETFMEQLP